jgi:hypothetical protein
MERKINLFDKIGNLIPGYKGYVIRDEKRNADKKFRDELVSRLNQSEEYLIRYQRELVSSNNVTNLTLWEQTRKALNTISTKIKYTTYGESSFFSEKQLKEEELDAIYNIDLELTEKASLIVKTIQENTAEPMSAGFVLNQISDIEQILSKRTNFINEYK